MSVSTTLEVNGLTCDHCVRAVSDELGAIKGVKDVAVDLVAGGTSRVVITSERELASEDILDAIDEAGYTLAPSGAGD